MLWHILMLTMKSEIVEICCEILPDLTIQKFDDLCIL